MSVWFFWSMDCLYALNREWAWYKRWVTETWPSKASPISTSLPLHNRSELPLSVNFTLPDCLFFFLQLLVQAERVVTYYQTVSWISYPCVHGKLFVIASSSYIFNGSPFLATVALFLAVYSSKEWLPRFWFTAVITTVALSSCVWAVVPPLLVIRLHLAYCWSTLWINFRRKSHASILWLVSRALFIVANNRLLR